MCLLRVNETVMICLFVVCTNITCKRSISQSLHFVIIADKKMFVAAEDEQTSLHLNSLSVRVNVTQLTECQNVFQEKTGDIKCLSVLN